MVFPDMENALALVSKALPNRKKVDDTNPIDINFINQKYKWRIDQKNKKLSIDELPSDTNEELCSRELKEFELVGIHWRILDNNALALRQTMQNVKTKYLYITIYKYDITNEEIKISRLPIMNFEAVLKKNSHDNPLDTLCKEWLKGFIEDDRCLAIYGKTLLQKLINQKSIDYIEKVYSKCTKLVKENPKKNLKFLNIITLNMEDLYETYPDLIAKFNSEMFMFLDPSKEDIVSEYLNDDFHTFSEEIEIEREISKFGFINDTFRYFGSLRTPNPSDPNNPWTISNTFVQTDENGNILNQTFIQSPDENTNLFYSYPTSLLAMYLFLTGNQDSLSSWTPSENRTLFILMAVFSFLIVIYLMNLFIGLLNMAIEEDNDRTLYLVQKAEVIAEIELFVLTPLQRRDRT
ncbi:14150_t:CDS:2, partial [Funneliformis geosporum]